MDANVANRLLGHYRDHGRVLPWRAPPGAPPADPYVVWLSEIMLQQTTVAAVAPRFARFLARWPTVEALAEAPDDDVLGEWAGLGYYARARNLIACARVVAAAGGFPPTAQELRKLPGIGDYTAAAIAAIAFGEQATAIDTNVERVVARLLATSDKAMIRAGAEAMTPIDYPGDYTQAMMDLGATICRPKAPACSRCPIAQDCRAAALGTPEAFPAKPPRRSRPQRYGLAYWCRQDNQLRLTRRPPTGLLGGMAALPGTDFTDERPSGDPLAIVTHNFTHFALELWIVPAVADQSHGWWQSIDTIDSAGLPTLYRRAVEAGLAAERSPRLAA
jgi:A/G-specific adenine glycosylase